MSSRTGAEVDMSQILIVGAGVAGALAGQRLLAAGHDVVVVDKGHAYGGRLATRTVGDAVFDHGAQFLTAKSQGFQQLVDAWTEAGVARTWFHGSPDLNAADTAEGPTTDGPTTDAPDGHARYRGEPTMRRIGEHLAAGLDVRLGTVVEAVDPTAGGWRLRGTLRDGITPFTLEGDALVLTAPVPQTLALLDAGAARLHPEHRRDLERIVFEPCIAVLARPHTTPTLPSRGAARLEDGPIAWLTDNHATGASPIPAVTIHGSGDWSREHFGDPDAEVGRELVELARTHLGTDADVLYVHRWRYAKPTGRTHADSILDLTHAAPVAIAGDGLAGGRVEGAALSGLDAAARMIDHLNGS
jgi:renalase